MRFRGSDDEAYFEAPGVGFAFRRLSIIDVEGGRQPMSDAAGSVQVMLNGEIYGFAALRQDLERRGCCFATRSDTETIVHGYKEWGDAVFGRLDGMFAIAIWDAASRRLVLARDRLGKKPLYWAVRGGTVWFGSEPKALLAAGAVERDIDPVGLAAYFRNDAVPTPRSIFTDVQKLEPGSAMSWRADRVERSWRFWGPEDIGPAPEPLDPRAAVVGLRERLDRAVRERLVSDVPLGIFLSGGLDSAAVAESASRQSGARLQAFTVGFDDHTHDEAGAAAQVAAALGLDHHVERLASGAVLEMLETAVETLDEPLADPAVLPQLLLSRFAGRHVTVALTGDGGDELLLGYQHVPAHRWVERFGAVPPRIRSAFGGVLRRASVSEGYFSLGFKLSRFGRGLGIGPRMARDLAWRGAFDVPGLSALLLPEVLARADADWAERKLLEDAASVPGDPDGWRGWSWAYLRSYLLDVVLVKVDRATMRFSVEARSPLLDREVVRYLLSLPTAYKAGPWGGKRLLKELVAGRVPAAVLERPKHGFGVPTAAWLRGPLRERLRVCTEPSYLRAQGLFEPGAVARLVDGHLSGTADARKELWALLMFQLWHGRYARGS